MKILHLCLSNFYIDNRSYQENELIQQHVKQGHDVLVIASTETHSETGRTIYVKPGAYIGSDGARVIRVPYPAWLPLRVAAKLRFYPGIYKLINDFSPDSILFHGTCGGEILTVANYAKQHPNALFYVDSHEDWNNSARNFLSRELLHKRFYGPLLRKALPSIRKILCYSTEAMDFVEEVYKIPRSRLEFFPLGGRPVPDGEYDARRTKTRLSLGLDGENILVIQSGKQTKRKKLLESLNAFKSWTNANARFVISGSIDDEIKRQAEALIAADARITFVGWNNVENLTDLLCAADIYLQPGTQSVTMQHALCCRCAVILDDVPAHQVYLNGNGWLISETLSLKQILNQVDVKVMKLIGMKSYSIALNILDYSKLSKIIL